MIVINHRKSSDVVLLRIDASCLDNQDLTCAYLLGAGMAGFRARHASLREANLRNADLRAADLVGTDLRGAVLRGADLRSANLSDVLLMGADLRGADLRSADLRGADLSRAMLFEADLTGVRCDLETRWPAGDWGVVAQPVVQPDTLLERAGLQAAYQDARRHATRWRAAYGSLSQRLSTIQISAGVIGQLAGAAVAAALVLAAASNLEVDLGQRIGSGPLAPPTRSAGVPAPPAEDGSGPEEVIQGPARPAPASPQRYRVVARKPAPAHQPARRYAELRVVRRRTTSPRIARNDFSRPVRTLSLVSGSRSTVASRSRAEEERATRPKQVLLTASFTSQRSRPRPVTPAVLVTPARREEAPAIVRVAAVPPAPQVRPEPRPRKVQEAWGNQDFHYGSGYDIYTMHLGRRQD